MKFACYTLGCKVNQYETQAMEQLLVQSGHTLGSFDEICDGYIINTCTVTAVSDKKSRNAIRRVRKLNPQAVVGVCGCYAQSSPDEIRKLDVDVLIGTDGREAFVRHMIDAAQTRQKWDCVDDAGGPRAFEILPAGGLAARTRALLKVEDGCNNFCTYCIIPYARGRVRSMPLEAAVAQATGLAAEGYREIVITGIEIASWGKDLKNGKTLIDALEAVAAGARSARIHLGSLEPTVVTDTFVERLKKLNVCPHFHLSMQSGCDETLARMRRKYTTAEFFAVTERLRAAFPGCALTTDLITGFPGETEEEFSKTLAFIEKCAFAQMHVFPYSIRPGTKAAGMPGQIEKSEKAARAARAAHIAERMRREYLTSCVGKTLEVIFETESDGESRGHAENYTEVAVPGDMPHGVVRKVKITGVRGEMLVGTAL